MRPKETTRAAVDLASRLRRRERVLTERLARPDVQLSLIRAAHATLQPGRVAELIVEHLVEWMSAGPAALVVADAAELRVAAARGLTARLAPAARAVAWWVLRQGREFSSADLRHDARVEATGGAVFAWPLTGRIGPIAVVVLIDPRASAVPPSLSARTTALLEAALSGPAVALDNALAMERAEALSVTDDLTQVYNSRYFNQVLRRETKRALRGGRSLSLLFLDTDGFKAVNDGHGHLAGSRVLVEVAMLIRQSARESDVVARFGGDEFAVILPDTGGDGALLVADRVRDRVGAHAFLRAEGLEVRLTVSIGVATLPGAAVTADDLVKAADAAMYRVKASGKNGIDVARGAAASQKPIDVAQASS